MLTTDEELLDAFTEAQSDQAFEALVQRHLSIAFSTAYRVTQNSSLAEEVAQNVFIKLAHDTKSLKRKNSLGAWIHKVAFRLAIDANRSEQSRKKREQSSAELSENEQASRYDENWRKVEPVLDSALADLPEKDRTAVVLRFLENASYAEIGRSVGLNENAARMRVDRALGKLKRILQHKGIPTTAAALSAGLASSYAAPATSSSFATIALQTPASALQSINSVLMMKTKTMITAACVSIAACTTSGYLGFQYGEESANSERSDSYRYHEQTHVDEVPAQMTPAEPATVSTKRITTENLSAPSPDPAAEQSANSEFLRTFIKQMRELEQGTFRLEVFDSNGNITDTFATLYDLNETQRNSLTQSISEARESYYNLVKQNAVLNKEDDNSFSVSVSPFSGGADVYDALLERFQSNLGEAKFAEFLDVGDSELRSEFNEFGASQLEMDFKRTLDKDGKDRNGEPSKYRWDVKVRSKSDNGRSQNWHSQMGDTRFQKENDLAVWLWGNELDL
ncbi:RNA polymerase sigma factor [Pelagicoccus mobilis]|uniref:RNA polymerase sigma factor n=1 Tax=Pelagicoccus mobilis TaxID=415221 RepID=A0A934RUE5_9BACT|nr:RNA polymerase sigma factor [Pelagicoccus mobilis]MBK1875309.1 RNA polymerase sigma factor [Pelagicoccus mobilis]